MIPHTYFDSVKKECLNKVFVEKLTAQEAIEYGLADEIITSL